VHRATFNAIYQLPYNFQVAGLYRANFNTWTLNESNRPFGQPTQGAGGNSGAGGTAYQPRVVQLGFRALF
jgi:hypothetical protein